MRRDGGRRWELGTIAQLVGRGLLRLNREGGLVRRCLGADVPLLDLGSTGGTDKGGGHADLPLPGSAPAESSLGDCAVCRWPRLLGKSPRHPNLYANLSPCRTSQCHSHGVVAPWLAPGRPPGW